MTDDEVASLYNLGDRGRTIDGIVNDVHGRTVHDTDGADIGMVTDLLVDDHPHHASVHEHDGHDPYWGPVPHRWCGIAHPRRGRTAITGGGLWLP